MALSKQSPTDSHLEQEKNRISGGMTLFAAGMELFTGMLQEVPDIVALKSCSASLGTLPPQPFAPAQLAANDTVDLCKVKGIVAGVIAGLAAVTGALAVGAAVYTCKALPRSRGVRQGDRIARDAQMQGLV